MFLKTFYIKSHCRIVKIVKSQVPSYDHDLRNELPCSKKINTQTGISWTFLLSELKNIQKYSKKISAVIHFFKRCYLIVIISMKTRKFTFVLLSTAVGLHKWEKLAMCDISDQDCDDNAVNGVYLYSALLPS